MYAGGTCVCVDMFTNVHIFCRIFSTFFFAFTLSTVIIINFLFYIGIFFFLFLSYYLIKHTHILHNIIYFYEILLKRTLFCMKKNVFYINILYFLLIFLC